MKISRVVAVMAVVAVLAAGAGLQAQPAEFRIVVHASNPTTRLTKAQLTEFFLDPAAHWEHGGEVSPVDQSTRSPIREVFTRRVIGRTVDWVVNQWKQRMMTEREPPPPVKSSDADVIQHVAKNKNAIGYVSASGTLPTTVKAVTVVE
jgi:ABC-type phosphate transport system substrate-binding protein